MKKPFEIIISKSARSIEIIFQIELYTLEWRCYAGEITKTIETVLINPERQYTLILNFLVTKWADPLVILSIILIARKWKEHKTTNKKDKSNNVTIKVNYIPDNPELDQTGLPTQYGFLKFLHTEGFLILLKKLDPEFEFYQNKQRLTKQNAPNQPISIESQENRYDSIPLDPIFTESSILIPLVIDLSRIRKRRQHEKKVKMKVTDPWLVNDPRIRGELKNIDPGINTLIELLLQSLAKKKIGYDKIPRPALNDMLGRMKVFLYETLNIAREVSYKSRKKENEGKPAYCGIYIRYRSGLLRDNLSDSDAIKIFQAIEREKKYMPQLDEDYLTQHDGAFEIFVLDHGNGIEHQSTSTEKPQVNTIVEDSLKMFEDIFDENGDNLLAFVGSQFFLPEAKRIAPTASDIHPESGMAWLGRTRWAKDTDNQDEGWEKTPQDAEVAENKVWQAYQNREADITFGQSEYYVHDARMMEYRKAKNLVDYYSNKKVKKDFCLFLPSKNQTRNALNNTLRDQILPDFKGVQKSTLIIADINTHEAKIFENFVKSASNKIINVFEKIILVTRRQSVKYFSRLQKDTPGQKGYEYDHDKAASKAFFTGTPESGTFNPDTYMSDVMLWVRAQDSYLYWKNIKWMDKEFSLGQENKIPQVFINGNINWLRSKTKPNKNDTKQPTSKTKYLTINGYLAFFKTLNDPLAHAIYRRLLQRIPGFTYTRRCKIKEIDDLGKRLSEEFNAKEFIEHEYDDELHEQKSQKVLLQKESNSEIQVYELGGVLIDIRYGKATSSQKHKKRNQIFILKHPQSKSELPALLQWPAKNWIDNNFPEVDPEIEFERIGRTHLVSEKGKQHFQIPRYRKDEDSYYFRNPRDTYRDWQQHGPPLLRIGHMDYNGYHELLYINFKYSLDNSFVERKELAGFLLVEIYKALGGDFNGKNGIKKHYRKFFESYRNALYKPSEHETKDKEYKNTKDKWSKTQKECAIIAYPSHFHTEAAINNIRKLLKTDYQQRLVSIWPLHSQSNQSSYLFSPMEEVFVQRKIKEWEAKNPQKEIRVMLFDDGIVSGRTRRSLQHNLESLGAKEVLTLCVVDRMRLPLEIPHEKEGFRAFWRLDAPRLGNNAQCPLCAGLRTAEDFSRLVISSFARNRMYQWKKNWTQTPPWEGRESHGLGATKLNFTQEDSRKVFGIKKNQKTGDWEQIGGEKNKIELVRSTGLTVFLTELYSMAGRDDLPLEFVQMGDETVPKQAKIEFLATLLLLFGNELKDNIQTEMTEHLFRNLAESTRESNHTALASLVLMRIKQEKLREIFIAYTENYMQKVKSEEAVNIDKYANEDFKIVLAYILSGLDKEEKSSKKFFKEWKEASRLLKSEKSSNKFFKEWKEASRLLKSEKELISLYTGMYTEMANEEGAWHALPLPKAQAYGVKTSVELTNLAHSIDHLWSIITELNNDLVREPQPYAYGHQDYYNTSDTLGEKNPQWKNNALKALDTLKKKIIEIERNSRSRKAEELQKKAEAEKLRILAPENNEHNLSTNYPKPTLDEGKSIQKLAVNAVKQILEIWNKIFIRIPIDKNNEHLSRDYCPVKETLITVWDEISDREWARRQIKNKIEIPKLAFAANLFPFLEPRQIHENDKEYFKEDSLDKWSKKSNYHAIFDRKLKKIVRDLMLNGVHAAGKIESPFALDNNPEERINCEVWFRVIYTPERVIIQMINLIDAKINIESLHDKVLEHEGRFHHLEYIWSKGPGKMSKKNLKNKKYIQHSEIMMRNKTVYPNGKLLCCNIYIPYVHRL